jgi:hypothetical protein
MAVTLNASTSSGFIQTADTSGNLALQSNGTTQLTVSSTGAYGQLKASTAVASTSGTSIEFTSIPSWVKRITLMFSGVGTNGANNYQIQIGSGSYTTSSYGSQIWGGTNTRVTTGFIVSVSNPSFVFGGIATLVNISANNWVCTGVFNITDTGNVGYSSAGTVSLSGTLDRLRIIGSATGSPSDTFDAGIINILYEG